MFIAKWFTRQQAADEKKCENLAGKTFWNANATGFGFVLGLRRREQLNINASREDCPSTYAYLNK